VSNTTEVVLAEVEFRLLLKLRSILRSTQNAYSQETRTNVFGIGMRRFATLNPDVGKSSSK
jgi:hypothetical protein